MADIKNYSTQLLVGEINRRNQICGIVKAIIERKTAPMPTDNAYDKSTFKDTTGIVQDLPLGKGYGENYSIIDSEEAETYVCDLDSEKIKIRKDPGFTEICCNAFRDFMKKAPEKYSGVKFSYPNEGYVSRDYDQNEDYKVVITPHYHLEANEVWFSINIFTHDWAPVYSNHFEIRNIEQYERNLGGICYIGDGREAVILPSEFFHNDEY